MAYEYEDEEPAWRRWWRMGCGSVLALALILGLTLSLRPDRDSTTELAGGDGEPAATEGETPGAGDGDGGAGEGEADDAGEDAEGDDGEEGEEGEVDAEEQARREELIESAGDPEETSVQVLDGGAGSGATDAAASVLRDLGYDVVATNPSRTDVATTTILYTDGNEAEAEALRARDERFAEVTVNDRLSDAVDIHVIVGSDWSG